MAGQLDRRKVLAQERHQLGRRHRGARLQHHERLGRLAAILVRHADHRDLGHRRVAVDRLLDRARVHVVAAAQDEVLDAVDDREVAVPVHHADVAGAKPPVRGERGRRLLRPVPVAQHHLRPAHAQLAAFADRHALHRFGRVAQLLLGARHRLADRAAAVLAGGRVAAGAGARFGQAVALDHDAAGPRLEPPLDLRRQGRAAADAVADRRQVRLARKPRQRVEHGRHGGEVGRPGARDGGDRVGRHEAGQHHDLRAGVDREQQHRGQREYVKERQRRQHPLLPRAGRVEPQDALHRVGVQVGMAEHGPFR